MKIEEIAKQTIDEVAADLSRSPSPLIQEALSKPSDESSEPNSDETSASVAPNTDEIADTPSEPEPIKSPEPATITTAPFDIATINPSKNISISITTDSEELSETLLATQKADIEPSGDDKLLGEVIFLKNLKERIAVLFEGLNATTPPSAQSNSEEISTLRLRLELTTKFLEYTLATIEHRLLNISK